MGTRKPTREELLIQNGELWQRIDDLEVALEAIMKIGNVVSRTKVISCHLSTS